MSTATLAMRRNQNLYRSQSRMQLGPISLSFITIAVVCVLALLYLTQITKTSVYGYKITDLNQKRDKILAEKQELEVEAARLQSIERVQASARTKNMVAQGTATYVSQ